jgi:hypothetical protein
MWAMKWGLLCRQKEVSLDIEILEEQLEFSVQSRRK